MTRAVLAWVSEVPAMDPEVSNTKVTSRAGPCGSGTPAPPDTGGMTISRP